MDLLKKDDWSFKIIFTFRYSILGCTYELAKTWFGYVVLKKYIEFWNSPPSIFHPTNDIWKGVQTIIGNVKMC